MWKEDAAVVQGKKNKGQEESAKADRIPIRLPVRNDHGKGSRSNGEPRAYIVHNVLERTRRGLPRNRKGEFACIGGMPLSGKEIEKQRRR